MKRKEVSIVAIEQDFPICLDSGASISISPVRSNFIGPINPLANQIQGSSVESDVFFVTMKKCEPLKLVHSISPEANILMCSSQVYFSGNLNESLLLTQEGVVFTTADESPLSLGYSL